ncbi:O-antigen ligase family protein [Azospirillum sp. SYSU D00513]|uniref:O-antigen ligase family protein n=1 Tax=Azospirillum sp. SYSU D00513 TaxID=2812561 RepID=UPI001A97A5B0|nr:O-antigen ligase family protein [Azospirillum sp. SYSU D00513]
MYLLSFFLIGGYLVFGRPFAYLGFSPLFPAEAFLLLSIILLARRWIPAILNQIAVLRPITLWLGLGLVWGGVAVLRGVSAGYDLEIALKEFAANYYVLFFFFGEIIGHQIDRKKLAKFYVVAGLLAGLNGILYASYTSRLDIYLPWAPDVSAFDTPAMVSYLIVGLVAFSAHSGIVGAVAIAVDIIAALANPGRALWLSILLGGGLVVALQSNTRTLLRVGSGTIAVGIIVITVGGLIPASEGRGGSLDPSWIAAQVVASFDADSAHEMLVDGGQGSQALDIYARHGTIDWRFDLWTEVLDSLETPELWLFGHGYGPELSDIGADVEGLRTPHNFLIYLLCYTGLVGAALYLGLSACFILMFLRLPSSPYRSCLLGQFLVVWSLALFGNALETPFIAVPFYCGMGLLYGAARMEWTRRVKAQ